MIYLLVCSVVSWFPNDHLSQIRSFDDHHIITIITIITIIVIITIITIITISSVNNLVD